MCAGGLEVDCVEAHAVLADETKFRHRAKHGVVQHLVARDRFRVPPEKPDQRVAGKHVGGFVESSERISMDELLAQGWIS